MRSERASPMRAARRVTVVLLFGCGVGDASQSQQCKDYLVCLQKSGMPSRDATYGPTGTCWSTTHQAASECTMECEAGSLAIKTSVPDAGCL